MRLYRVATERRTIVVRASVPGQFRSCPARGGNRRDALSWTWNEQSSLVGRRSRAEPLPCRPPIPKAHRVITTDRQRMSTPTALVAVLVTTLACALIAVFPAVAKGEGSGSDAPGAVAGGSAATTIVD